MIINYEILQKNETNYFEKYYIQIDILKARIQYKCPSLANRHGVVFHQDNARPYVSVSMLQKLNGSSRMFSITDLILMI